MRILVLNYEFPPLGGGASPVSWEISKRYVQNGHDVDVITMAYKNLPKHEIIEGVNIYRIKCLRSKKEICHPWEQLSYLIAAWFYVKKLFLYKKYDICHTHFIIPTGVLALRIKKKYGLNYIVSVHGSDVIGHNKRFAKLYPLLIKPWKNIIKNALAVSIPSKYIADKIKETTSDGNFVHIPNGIDLSRFRSGEKEKRILIVSRLFENKGVQDILDALKIVDIQDWQVDIVGEGPYRKILEEKSRINELKNKVTFHGWIDNSDCRISEFYAKATIFISASYFECMPIGVLEAIASGCTPILSDIGGHRSIVNDDIYFFEKGNANDLAMKLKKYLQGSQGIEKININTYDWNNVSEKFENLLFRLYKDKKA